MTADVGPTRDETQRFYEDFSLAVGLRDWLTPNPRHEQLKLFIRDLLGGRRGLKIADVGCGAGVMTSNLRRYGDVTGLDFSSSAVRAAQRLVPGVRFLDGSLEALHPEERFDLVTLFDVLEHIPQHERQTFLGELRARLVDGGLLFFSTPCPAYTAYRRENRDETLQIVDEEVELQDVMVEAGAVGLQLLEYRAFDVFRGSPEYQMMLFTTAMAPGGQPTLRSPALRRRLRWVGTPGWNRSRRVAHAAQLAALGRFREARWVLTGRAPTARS